jgi:hypothetical protein
MLAVCAAPARRTSTLFNKESTEMIRKTLMFIGVLAIATSAFAQADEIDRATAAAPRNAKDAAMVIHWKADFTYDTLRPATASQLVCYDQSGQPNEQPFSSQCTSIANLPRVAQNKKFEQELDRDKRNAALAAAEKDGTRIKPEFGSPFMTLAGADRASARMHTTIAVPGATTATMGLPENGQKGGAWIMNAGTSTAHIMVPGS